MEELIKNASVLLFIWGSPEQCPGGLGAPYGGFQSARPLVQSQDLRKQCFLACSAPLRLKEPGDMGLALAGSCM